MNYYKRIFSLYPEKPVNIRGKLIVFTTSLILFLILVNFILFYISTDRNYIEQLEISNESLVKQIGSSYEMVIKYIANSVYKTALYDMDLLELVKNYSNSREHQNSISEKLESIMLFNEYIQSVYLYLPHYNQVFSTANNISKISTFENFSDQVAFSMTGEKDLYTFDPRIVGYNDVKKQVLTIVSSVPLYNQDNRGFLVVNINMDQLRYNVLVKLKRDLNTNFYVVDQNNAVIITENIDNRLGTVLPETPENQIIGGSFPNNILKDEIVISTVYQSDFLKWKFILDTTFQTTSNYFSRIVWFVTISACLIIVSVLVIVTVFSIFTRPVNNMAEKYSEKLWKDYITDNAYISDDIKNQLFGGWFNTSTAKFGTIVLHIEGTGISDNFINHHVSLLNDLFSSADKNNSRKIRVVVTGKDMIAVIICYCTGVSIKECQEEHIGLAQLIYEKIDSQSRESIYLGISTIKEHISLLSSSYKECVEMFKYKLICSSHLLPYMVIKDRTGSYEYPYQLEKQLINNITVGNEEACLTILDEFFSIFMQPDMKIEDNEIRNSIYYLENSILKNIGGLSVSLYGSSDVNISNAKSIQKMKELVSEDIAKICLAYNEGECSEKNKIRNIVLAYLENRYTEFDISLNKTAYELNLNRNKVSKIIKEATGKSFTDYINEKRISLAKKLMNDKNRTIEDIAREVGFNYSYYFIKIFKNTEGITPGQYCSKINTTSFIQ